MVHDYLQGEKKECLNYFTSLALGYVICEMEGMYALPQIPTQPQIFLS